MKLLVDIVSKVCVICYTDKKLLNCMYDKNYINSNTNIMKKS